MNEKLITKLFKVLEIVVLEHVTDDRFKLTGAAPDWFRMIFPEALENKVAVKPGKKFLFLANFLTDARDFWGADRAGRLKSGHWIEKGSDGKQYQVEATAVSLGDKNLLLLESSQYSYKEKQFILKHGRDMNFEYKLLEQFEDAQQRYQDNLEKEVNKKTIRLYEENLRLKQELKELKKTLAFIQEGGTQ